MFQRVLLHMRDPWVAQPEWELFAYTDGDFERFTQFVRAAADGHSIEVVVDSDR